MKCALAKPVFPALIAALLAACAGAPAAPRSLSAVSAADTAPVAPPTPSSVPSSSPVAASVAASVPSSSPPEYTTPLLDAPTLSRTIQSACQAAVSERRPVLLEFSAPWCADCVALEKLKRSPALAEELQRWQLLPVNIGSGEEHPELMRAFRVNAIAKLVVLLPTNCAAPIGTWPRGAARTLDGLSKHTGGADGELAGWLASARVGRHSQ